MDALAIIPKYQAYKESGVDWLGTIPCGWDIRRIKFIFSEINERSKNGSEELLSVSQYTGVTRKSDKLAENDLLTNAETLEGYKKVIQGELVSNIMLAWNGSLGFSPFDGIVSPAYSVYRLLGENIQRYFHYLLRTEVYKAEYKRRSTGVIESRLRLYTDDFFDIRCLLPPVEEQVVIANFLDQKTAQIDEAIAIKEKQITLLKERKQIIIQKAVTQGLNPDVPMKESCVDWIGQIPEHWDLKKMKFIFETIQTGTTPTTSNPKYFDGGVDWYNPKDLNAGYLDKSEKTISKLAIKHGEAKIFSGNSVLIVGIGATCGKTAYLKEASSFNQQITGFNSRYQNSEFMYFLISTYSKVMLNVASYTTLPILNNEFFKRFMLPCPPRNEQDGIVSFLRCESEKLERAIEMQQQQIANLKEYKATLINSAVTGKIKVA